MRRIALKNLLDWKNSSSRKPLILNGARQVGKTWLLREFAKSHYTKEAYIVCRKNELAKQIFSHDFDIKRIIRDLSALSKVDITPGDTLIILDEVQDIPEAIESLKYFYEQAPEYHIAVAGSLLGISLHQGVSFPVGKVDELNIFPMDFREFLDALGEEQMLNLLKERDFNAITPLHQKFIDLLRQYYYVGGMPEAVKLYVETGALQGVRKIQKSILHGYEQDFSKHAPKDQVEKIKLVWKSAPSQLFKENKKFIYGALRKGARATQYEEAIEWLTDSGLLYKVPRASKPALPINLYEELNVFKLYALDVGLLGAMANTDASQILIKCDLIAEYNGGLAEQFILQQMKAQQIDPIYYHSTDDSRLEIDFMIQSEGELLPIEVKSGESVRANSLSKLLQSNPELHAIRYSMLPYKEQGQLTNVPLYAV
ncbi:MAG: ATP-binding protein [Fibrobacter sp.]|jgi:hypothetical protein|nr:ATP-binding protein [Fibrobacter sp.]MBQ3778127.1 ATP-binding protein [Fibrobacter sp.]